MYRNCSTYRKHRAESGEDQSIPEPCKYDEWVNCPAQCPLMLAIDHEHAPEIINIDFRIGLTSRHLPQCALLVRHVLRPGARVLINKVQSAGYR